MPPSESPVYLPTEAHCSPADDWSDWTSFTLELEVHPTTVADGSSLRYTVLFYSFVATLLLLLSLLLFHLSVAAAQAEGTRVPICARPYSDLCQVSLSRSTGTEKSLCDSESLLRNWCPEDRCTKGSPTSNKVPCGLKINPPILAYTQVPFSWLLRFLGCLRDWIKNECIVLWLMFSLTKKKISPFSCSRWLVGEAERPKCDSPRLERHSELHQFPWNCKTSKRPLMVFYVCFGACRDTIQPSG